ncbi:MAG: CaiB/BaiF CoA transferase family protein [Dehalococcoidia bacterium]
MAKALQGIRVLEMTIAVAGPVCCHILGDMGAEVIKVEEPMSRARTPMHLPKPIEGAPDHPYNRVVNFNELNRSKKLLSLNVAKPEGREIYLKLAAQCDVMVENFAPRVVGNLGIDYESVKKVNPGIIYVSMPAFGKTGPYKDRGSYGPGIDAMSGISHLTGYPEGAPGKPANFFCDQNAGLHAAFAILTALRHKRRTGEGQYIEMSMLEGELQAVAPAIMDVTLNGRDGMRVGNKHHWYAPHGVYPCAGEDRWAAIAVTSDEQWQALCGVMGRADLAADAQYREQAGRYARQEVLDEAIAAWTKGLAPYEVQERLQAVGVPAGAVLQVDELFTDPQLKHRGSFAWADHPEIGPFPHTRTAWLSQQGNHGVSPAGPTFGSGNDRVLRELLKLSDAEVDALVEAQVTSYAPVGEPRPH